MPSPGGGVWLTVTLPVKPSQLPPKEDPRDVGDQPSGDPPGTRLFIGSFPIVQTIFMDLVYTNSHTCSYAQQPSGIPWPPGIP